MATEQVLCLHEIRKGRRRVWVCIRVKHPHEPDEHIHVARSKTKKEKS